MKHEPYLANDLIIRSLEAKVEKMAAEITALKRLVGKLAKVRKATPPSPDEALKAAPILDRAARMHGCTVAEICGSRGSKRTILARAEAAHECQRAGISSVATGRVLGGRNHSTVLHLAARHRERLGIE
jgi:chromosomal replication initiation ATPase DnaA